MILASFITTVIAPVARIFGWLLAAFYSFTGSYGLAIILLTLVTMVVVFPLTRKGTRSMMQMQLLQPELLKMRSKYKKKPGMAPEERREQQAAQQEEMMALYRENGVSPTGGCLPMFMQFPVFIVLYNTIRGMTDQKTVGTGKAAHLVANPEFINIHTRLYQSLIHSGEDFAIAASVLPAPAVPDAAVPDVAAALAPAACVAAPCAPPVAAGAVAVAVTADW